MKKEKILIFRIGALWDVLMTTPFIRELRKQNKGAQIDYLTWKSNYVLLKDNEYLNNILTMKNDLFFNYRFSEYFKLIFKIRKHKYDKIFVMDKHWIFALSSFLFWIKKRIWSFRDKLSKFFLTDWVQYWKQIKYEVDYYLELLWNIKDWVDKKLYFNLQKEDKKKIFKYLKENNIKDYVVVINDGGNNWFEVWWGRMLQDNKFKQLLENLSKTNKVFLLAWLNMKDYYDKFILNENIINVAWKFKIPESFALLKYAKKVYSTDCGPMHMASCVNNNVIWFFWPTHPKRKFSCIWWKYSFSKEDEEQYSFDYEDWWKISVWKKFFRDLDINNLEWDE